jgi:hypothetical protein
MQNKWTQRIRHFNQRNTLILYISINAINNLKPNGNNTYCVIYQSIILRFVHVVYPWVSVYLTDASFSELRAACMSARLPVISDSNSFRGASGPERLIVSQRDFTATHSLHSSVYRRVLCGATITVRICVQFKTYSCSARGDRLNPNLVVGRAFNCPLPGQKQI